MTTWFQNAFGFSESDYGTTQAKLVELHDASNNTIGGLQIGSFSIPSLGELRRATDLFAPSSETDALSFGNVFGEAGSMHRDPSNAGATFQVASQFNLLEFPGPSVTPEAGITDYINDPTQGPACAVACPAGTAFRNYLIQLSEERLGQHADLQVNTLADLQAQLPDEFLTVRNGYVNSNPEKLQSLNAFLKTRTDAEREALKELVRVGVHYSVQVGEREHSVNQVYASALSVGYTPLEATLWEPLARLVLEATYEATILVGLTANATNAVRGEPATPLYLTKVGGGVFRNRPQWIAESINKAVEFVRDKTIPLEIKLVHFNNCEPEYVKLEQALRSSSF